MLNLKPVGIQTNCPQKNSAVQTQITKHNQPDQASTREREKDKSIRERQKHKNKQHRNYCNHPSLSLSFSVPLSLSLSYSKRPTRMFGKFLLGRWLAFRSHFWPTKFSPFSKPFSSGLHSLSLSLSLALLGLLYHSSTNYEIFFDDRLLLPSLVSQTFFFLSRRSVSSLLWFRHNNVFE